MIIEIAAACALSLTTGGPEGVLTPLTPIEVQVEHEGIALQLDAAAYDQIRGLDHFTMRDFVISDQRVVDLELERFSVLSDDAQLVIEGLQGARATAAPEVVLLRGSVRGEENSQVYLALSPYGCNGFLRLPDESFIIAGNEAGVNYIYSGELLGEFARIQAECGGALIDPNSGIGQAVNRGGTESSCGAIRVAVETDWEYRSRLFSSDAAAQAYVVTLWGAIAEIYRSELDVTIEVPFVRIWSTDTDPYPAGSSVNTRLSEFLNHWNSSMGSVQRSVAHMLTGRSSGAGGVAYLNSLCNGSAYGTSGYLNGSFPMPVRNNDWGNWDLVVVSHELGHNFGAPHTHDIGMDGCGLGDCSLAPQGTIMSYCHTCGGGISNIALQFGQRMIDERIRPYLDTYPCGNSVTPPYFVQQPASLTRKEGQQAKIFANVRGSSLRTYRWQKDGVDLSDGATGTGSTIFGSGGLTLTINNPGQSDRGSYVLRATETCFTILSDPANLIVLCRSDVNADNSVDFGDFLGFFNAFDAFAPEADIDGVPGVDFGDFLAFFNSFDAGC